MHEVISLDARRPLSKKRKKDDPSIQIAQQPSPALAAAKIISQRKCLVCTKPTGATHRRYCSEHNSYKYRWLECVEPGCEIVGERAIPGQTLYRCPAHRSTASKPSPARKEPAGDNAGRNAVRALLAERRHNLARERTVSPLPPRPPYNIGHYDYHTR